MKERDPFSQIDQFIREIDRAKDKRSIGRALRKQINLLGFENFAYQIFRTHQSTRPPPIYLTSYPDEWASRYEEQKYKSHDLVGRHAMRVVRPFQWSEIGRFDDFTVTQKLIFNEATEFGIRSGGTIGISGPGLFEFQGEERANKCFGLRDKLIKVLI